MRLRATSLSRANYPIGSSLNADDFGDMLGAMDVNGGASPMGDEWYVDTNTGVGDDGFSGHTTEEAFLTLDNALDNMASGDTVYFRGNINEQITSPTGLAGITIVGAAGNPQHADTHPLNVNKYAATWKIGSLGNNPLLILRNPGWTFENILFAAHASNYAVRLERNAVEDATEQDASHARFINCRFASGAGGISDTGGCFNVKLYKNTFGALTTACILGVGNIGAGQVEWELLHNKFLDFTNGVKIVGLGCVIKGNFFTDGGTPDTTFVLNTNNGALAKNNFVVGNYFQTADAQYSTPDLVGCATDVWRNELKDATAKTGTP